MCGPITERSAADLLSGFCVAVKAAAAATTTTAKTAKTTATATAATEEETSRVMIGFVIDVVDYNYMLKKSSPPARLLAFQQTATIDTKLCHATYFSSNRPNN